jgi:hypothetical protein
VRLRYGRNQTVSWTGDVTFVSSGKTLVRTGPNSYALVPTSTGIPRRLWCCCVGGTRRIFADVQDGAFKGTDMGQLG